MVWWWIGNAVFVLVVIPVVVLLLHRLLQPVEEIRAYVDDVAEHAGRTLEALGAAAALTETRSLVGDVRSGVERYGAALDDLLPRS